MVSHCSRSHSGVSYLGISLQTIVILWRYNNTYINNQPTTCVQKIIILTSFSKPLLVSTNLSTTKTFKKKQLASSFCPRHIEVIHPAVVETFGLAWCSGELDTPIIMGMSQCDIWGVGKCRWISTSKAPGLIAVRGNFPTFYGFHSHKVAPTETSTQYNMIKYLKFGLLNTKRSIWRQCVCIKPIRSLLYFQKNELL